MAESHVISGLVAKRSELAGLIEHHQKAIDRIAADLSHVDATIKLFSPQTDLRTLRPKEYRERNRYFKPREQRHRVGAVDAADIGVGPQARAHRRALGSAEECASEIVQQLHTAHARRFAVRHPRNRR